MVKWICYLYSHANIFVGVPTESTLFSFFKLVVQNLQLRLLTIYASRTNLDLGIGFAVLVEYLYISFVLLYLRHYCTLSEAFWSWCNVPSSSCEFHFHRIWREGEPRYTFINYWYDFIMVSWVIFARAVFLFFKFWLSNLAFKLHAEELERWFTKIDHIFEHSRIPQIGEVLTPFYKISIDREQRHRLPLVSHISYKYNFFLIVYWNISTDGMCFKDFNLVMFRESSNIYWFLCSFSVHAIELGEKVTSIFEHAIDVFGRKDDVLNTRYISFHQI